MLSSSVASLFSTLLLLTAGHVHFDSAAPEWRVVFASGESVTRRQPGMEVVCVEQWGDRCKAMKVLTGGVPVSAALTDRQAAETFTHELAHVLDGMDDGRFNGSPGHPWSQALQDAHYRGDSTYVRVCTSNLSEWYACEVVRTGTIR